MNIVTLFWFKRIMYDDIQIKFRIWLNWSIFLIFLFVVYFYHVECYFDIF